VDFLAPRARLVVEVDGGYHAARRQADGRRERFLRGASYRVLRVTATAVSQDLCNVLRLIAQTLAG
jgi:adenine-specific DNA-methyltransferase